MLKLSNQSGTVSIITILTLPMLLAFAALALGVGQVFLARSQVQACADAAALAGALYVVDNPGAVASTAADLATKNNCQLDSVVYGSWDGDNLTPGLYPEPVWPATDADMAGYWTNAVQVLASQSVIRIFGRESITVTRTATAVKRIKQDPDTLLWNLAKGSALVQ